VADDLVNDVRLGRVERLRRVADVLRGVEDAVGQRAVELAQRDEPGRRVISEAASWRVRSSRETVRQISFSASV
jgi:hypothetical protein